MTSEEILPWTSTIGPPCAPPPSEVNPVSATGRSARKFYPKNYPALTNLPNYDGTLRISRKRQTFLTTSQPGYFPPRKSRTKGSPFNAFRSRLLILLVSPAYLIF